MTKLTSATLGQLLRYEPETGRLVWLPRSILMFSEAKRPARAASAWNAAFAGRPALTAKDRWGYLCGAVLREHTKAHRVAYIMTHDILIPRGMHVDHINGVKDDNRAANLRLATPSQNGANVDRSKAGKLLGTYKQPSGKWLARASLRGVRHRLGLYATEQEAHEAWREFTNEAYGEYAYHNRRQE